MSVPISRGVLDVVHERDDPEIPEKYVDTESLDLEHDERKHSIGAVKRRITTKVKAIFNHGEHNEHYVETTIAQLPDDPKNPLRLDNKHPPDAGEKFKEFIKHPVSAVTGAIVERGGIDQKGSLVSKEVSHSHEVELIKANKQLELAEKHGVGIQAAEEKVEALKAGRQDMYTRWALDRNVHRIRKVSQEAIKQSHPDPTYVGRRLRIGSEAWIQQKQELLMERADRYGYKYIGIYSDPFPVDEEILKASFERFLVGSAALQEVFMKFRPIYRWEDRNKTLFCLAVFLCLWAFDLLIPVGLISVIIQVLKRRSPPDIMDLRNEIIRIEDSNTLSLNLLEFMEKHGTENWSKQLLERIGPPLLMMMADVASLTEVMLGFYEWRNPHQTTYSLSILTGMAIVTIFVPFWLIAKTTILLLGLMVFFISPVCSHYPEYRYLVSPARLLFWDIPDNPTWAIARLQKEASDRKNNMHDKPVKDANQKRIPPQNTISDSSSSPTEESHDMAKYTAANHHHAGRLVINTTHLRFETDIHSKELWRIPWDRLHRVEKAHNQPIMRSGHDLYFWDDNGTKYEADNLEDRNEAFVQIVGYSGIEWQVVG